MVASVGDAVMTKGVAMEKLVGAVVAGGCVE